MIFFGSFFQAPTSLMGHYSSRHGSQISLRAILNAIIARLCPPPKLTLMLAACLYLNTYTPAYADSGTRATSWSSSTNPNPSNIDTTISANFAQSEVTIAEDSNKRSIAELPPARVPQNQLLEPNLYALLDAEFAADRGDIERALTIYKQQAFKEDATAVFERALSLSLRNENVESSLEFAKAWQNRNPDHVPAWFYMAHLALKAHNYSLAGETLDRILRYDPRADLSEILIGIYPNTDSDQRELLSALQPIDSEQNASLSVLKAGLLYQFDEPQAALVHINRALANQPNYVPFITLKTDILRKLELRAATDSTAVITPPTVAPLDYINQARLRNPNSKSLYLYEIRYLLDLKQSQAAWELLLEAHERFNEDAEITLLAALVSLDIEAYPSADRLLNILARDPSYLDQAYYYLGISAERQQRFEQAKSYLNRVMQEDLVLAARKKVVDLELLEDNAAVAISVLEKLRSQFEVFAPDSYVLQADILRQYGEFDAALGLLTSASRQYPNSETILFARVQLLDDRNDYVVKRTLLNHLQSLDPSNISYQLSYAQLLLANDQNSEQGLALARAVIQIRYDDPRYDNELHLQALNVLASNALANKDYTQVVNYLQTPYDVLPTLRSGVLLLRAYQGLGEDQKVESLLADLQQRFSFGQRNVNDRVQLY